MIEKKHIAEINPASLTVGSREAVPHVCGNCEYYDGGGLGLDDKPFNTEGDCHNAQSGRFQTKVTETCHRFFLCTTRWPRKPARHVARELQVPTVLDMEISWGKLDDKA